jgi:hypothetical protein
VEDELATFLNFPFQWVPDALSLRVKWLGCEADHSPPSSAEVNNVWSYTSTPPIRLHGVVPVHRYLNHEKLQSLTLTNAGRSSECSVPLCWIH